MDKFNVTGRYMEGTEVIAYGLESDSGERKRVSKIQLCYMIGKGSIENCTCSPYGDDMVLRGIGIRLKDLPVLNVSSGKVTCKGNDSSVDNKDSSKLKVVCILRNKDLDIGYEVVSNNSNETKRINVDTMMRLVEEHKVSNAKLKTVGGKSVIEIDNMDNIKIKQPNKKGKREVLVEDAKYIIEAVKGRADMEIKNAVTGEVYMYNHDSDLILRGLVGEMWVESIDFIVSRYCKADGTSINVSDIGTNKIKIRLKERKRYKAVFVPKEETMQIYGKTVNDPSVKHGKGDYVVYRGAKDPVIVNGVIFDKMYNIVNA